ncbi:MAG TPA: alkaline phosphatase D family protein [Polyangia bacterium]|jgi:alkaline phosphatase D|nr:alkaline phosphatase D family protein [Polyangia bacterium]
MKRRDFLKTSGYFFLTASLSGVTGCPSGGNRPGAYSFPQGVASGDPRENTVVLWTRVQAASGTPGSIPVTVEASTTANFATLIASREFTATAAADYTLRIVFNGLNPGTIYYYRFRAGADTSIVGRTRTAPDANADARVNFAWVSCQDYQAGFYSAYRRMLLDDQSAAEADQIHFVVHVGDFIYETRGDGFQEALDANFQPITLRDRNSRDRVIDAFPDGGTPPGGGALRFANTLADYRHLYRQFLRDPDLQAARARWPFINIWDDHEFSDDYWQTQANYDRRNTYDEPSQRRKAASNQAWFEYIPALLTGATGVTGVTPKAHDFNPLPVTDTPYNDSNIGPGNQIIEPNNLNALDTLTIYRSLRFGRHVELVLTDLRSYRSDQPIPEELTFGNATFFSPRNALPLVDVNVFDAGRTYNNNNPPNTSPSGLQNTRKNSPAGTMMGPVQKQWWKDTVRQSAATWKIWASSVSVMRMLLDASGAGLPDLVASADAWDGYATERNEILQYLLDNNVRNIVTVSGDIHAHFAGLLYNNFDAASPVPVMPEFTVTGVSSNTLFSFYEAPTRSFPDPIRQLITYDVPGGERFIRNMNTTLLYGGPSAYAAAAAAQASPPQDQRAAALAARDPNINPHIRYVDTDARGYGLMSVTASGVTAVLVTIPAPVQDQGDSGATVKSRATFTVAASSSGTATLDPPQLTGTPPFPL